MNDSVSASPYIALRERNFRFFLIGNTIAIIGSQMQTAAIGWELYERTNSPLVLGGVGLVQLAPGILLALIAGDAADRFSRRAILVLATAIIALSAVGLYIVSLNGGSTKGIYACLLLSGVARAFYAPARSAFLPQIVSRGVFPNAVTWNSGGFQLASVIGPTLGGLIIAATQQARLAYLFNAFAALCFLVFLLLIENKSATVKEVEQVGQTEQANAAKIIVGGSSSSGGGGGGGGGGAARSPKRQRSDSLLAGLRFVWQTPILLAAMTLDLFAVLLGGATALLPVYARDILQVGANGLGWLLAAPAVGAVLMTFAIAHLPTIKKAGRALLWAVAGFGVATVVFGLSRSFGLSLAMLFALGALDQISVVIRATLVQLSTPDAMRGRVSAVNGMFIGASNELGRFESGTIAQLFTPVFSVVSGGIGTILIVVLVALLAPSLRRYGALGSAAK